MVKIKPLHFLPNLITLAGLFCGCLGVVWALDFQIQWAVYMIWTCAILDLLDGLIARGLGVSSVLGKQLDSLSDLISFGLLPATIIYSLSSGYLNDPWPYASFVLPLFSALRLARFNLDPEQNIDFKGLPTPANALLISSFPALIDQINENLRLELENPVIWLLIIGILSYLLVSKIRLFGFKFQNLNWADNKYRYLFIAMSLITWLVMGILAIPVIMLLYLLMSAMWQYSRR
jgi:CDP-diacylglycerol--serine O-phosphatidyltransferase